MVDQKLISETLEKLAEAIIRADGLNEELGKVREEIDQLNATLKNLEANEPDLE